MSEAFHAIVSSKNDIRWGSESKHGKSREKTYDMSTIASIHQEKNYREVTVP
jgi:hypothetical protein